MNLVIIPFHDWKKCEREGFRTRDAHLMKEFAQHESISKMLVINRPISFSEMALLRRNVTPLNGKLVFKRDGVYISQVSEKVFTLDILVREILRPLLMKRSWTPYIFAREHVYKAVQEALQYLGIAEDYVLFLSAPISVPLARRLAPTKLIFDALDNFMQHASYRHLPDLRSYYQFCLDRADFISSNSLATAQWFREYRDDAQHIPNGVDESMFVADSTYTLPEDMLGLPRPIIGYAGKMQEMFDLEMMQLAIEAVPEASFVFIGQLLDKEWMKPLWKLKNVYYLGDKNYTRLPQYLAAFDICIIPYATERQHGGDPIKFYEYLAMGKPVVTTAIGNVTAFAHYPQVRIAHSKSEFAQGLKGVVSLLETKVPIQTMPVPPEYAWRNKAHLFVEAALQAGS